MGVPEIAVTLLGAMTFALVICAFAQLRLGDKLSSIDDHLLFIRSHLRDLSQVQADRGVEEVRDRLRDALDGLDQRTSRRSRS